MDVNLRPFAESDFERLISWLPTPDALAQWCAAFFAFPLDRAQLQRYVDSAKQPHVREIFVATATSGEAVGHVEVSMIWPHLSCRLSRVLVAPQARRKGLGRAIVTQTVRHAFATHHVDRIDLGVAADNRAAIGCYEALGFAHVGVWREAIVAAGRSIDVSWMTLTRAAWAAWQDTAAPSRPA